MNGGFVAENLGFGHVTREQIIQEHTRPLVQTILGDRLSQPAILVLDGTYIYTHTKVAISGFSDSHSTSKKDCHW